MDRATAGRFLTDRYGTDARGVAELGAGAWSRAFSFRLRGRDLVLRLGEHVQDFRKDQRAMAFAGPDLPIPAVLEIGEAEGGFYAVSERAFGTFLERLDEGGWRRVLPALLRALDALRQTPPPGPGVDWANEAAEPLAWREFLTVTLQYPPGMRTGGRRSKLKEAPEIEAVFLEGERALQALLPACPEARHLIHRDLLNRNVLVAEDGARLNAAFDWGTSIAGDFLYEIACLTFWEPWYPALAALDLRRAVREHCQALGVDVEQFEERLTAYELHVGLEHIGYNTFRGADDDRRDVARRTAEIIAGRVGRPRYQRPSGNFDQKDLSARVLDGGTRRANP